MTSETKQFFSCTSDGFELHETAGEYNEYDEYDEYGEYGEVVDYSLVDLPPDPEKLLQTELVGLHTRVKALLTTLLDLKASLCALEEALENNVTTARGEE